MDDPNFLDLSDEVLLMILKLLGPSSIGSLRRSCQRLWSLCQEASLCKKVAVWFEGIPLTQNQVSLTVEVGIQFFDVVREFP